MSDPAFDLGIMLLERSLGDAAGRLQCVSEATLEALAGEYANAVNSDAGKAMPPPAVEKGRAFIELLSAAAEYKRAASRYARACLAHALGPHK